MKDIFNSRKVSQDLKFRIFQAYIEPIFLFNSELWTLNKTQEKKIDAFQRKLYRRVLNIYWPKIITNVKVYEKAKSDKWSNKIRKSRLKWFGHMARLPEDTPARKAFNIYLEDARRPQGRPILTWYQTVYDDLKQNSNINIDFTNKSEATKSLIELCQERIEWKNIVKCTMLQSAT